MFFHHFLFYRLSVFLEPIDPARKKHPVNNLEVLTLSYKVSNVGVFAYISFRLFEAANIYLLCSLKVPWPVDIVISSECQKIYNQVFLLLLQIKWAKYSLDTLRFSGMSFHRSLETTWSCEWNLPMSCFYYRKLFVSVDFMDVTKKLEGALGEEVKVKEPINQQIHRMCLLRVKLMHFVNSLHNYITTRVRRVMKQTFSQQTVEFVECHQSSLSEFSHY